MYCGYDLDDCTVRENGQNFMDPVLLIFVALAAFVIFRLFSVLGTRTGHESRPDVEGLQRPQRPQSVELSDDADPADDIPAPKKAAISDAGKSLQEADPSFDELQFLQGARSAYEMIVEAFAVGDLKSVRRFLADPVYEAFKAAVAAREEAGQKFDLKFVGIDEASVVESVVGSKTIEAVTAFSSNQVRATFDADGNVVDGDPNRIDLIKDRWTFSRNLKSKDPNWILVATGGTA